jgi:hypothetical protein
MKRSATLPRGFLLAAILVLALPSVGAADDVRGHDAILCTAVSAMLCGQDGDCIVEQPWMLNIPQFVELNLKDKLLATTKASGENRSTPLRTIQHEDGLLILQGAEQGRAFSFVITEETGMLSVAVAREGKTVTVFGACTPTPSAK